jgi:hypothetical protein
MGMMPFPTPMTSPPSGGSGFVIITAVGAGTWNVPADFNRANNVIEVIAGGGNGGARTSGGGAKGGGAGQYAKLTNFNPGGGTVNYQIGIGGGSVGTSVAPGTADSWFDSASATLYAQGGSSPGTGGGLGPPGGSAAAVGTSTVANGGAGGNGGGLASQGCGAGGGAGGPHGAGAAGQSNGGSGGVNGGIGDAGNAPAGIGGSGDGADGGTESFWGPGIGPGGGGASGATTAGFPGGDGGGHGAGGGGGSGNSMGAAGILVIRWGDYATDVGALPRFTAAPVINSSAGAFCGVGDTLTATPGTTIGFVSSTTWQWYADGVAIGGATASSYALTAGELGKIVTVTEIVANSAGSASASASAIRFGPVVNPTFRTDTRVTSSGDIRVTSTGETRVTNTRIG